MKRFAKNIYIAFVTVMLTACTTSRNTPVTRFYHSFTARYNTYFNAHEAYKAGALAQEQGNKDNFTAMLPVFKVSNKATAKLGSGNFNTAIEKCEKAIKNHSIKRKPSIKRTRRNSEKRKKILAKREYNPFLKNAWMLMGISQFRQGEFIEAASTFSYINRLYAAEPEVLAQSRAWLAACYSELEWFYDAEDLFRNKLGRDSVPRQAKYYLDLSYADYYVKQQKYKEALPYLKEVVRKMDGSANRARIFFLMGQIYNQLGDKKLAYKYLSKVVHASPPYEVQLNARVLQAEVVSKSKSKSMLKRLRRMSKQRKNRQYNDQIFYAMGNIYIAEKDTANAILAYENGVSKSTRSGVEKGALLLSLAEIYYAKNDFASARRCYDKALGMISKERKDYEEIQKRVKIIDELEPHTTAVFVQDSMQALAKLPPEQQNAVFDKAIEIEKKRQKAERRRAILTGSKGATNRRTNREDSKNNQSTTTNRQQNDGKSNWYFYNPQAVANGKEAFARLWGERELADNWRRSNKEMTDNPDMGAAEEAENDTARQNRKNNSANTAEAKNDTASTKEAKGDKKEKELDENEQKLTREYYRDQLPVSDEQIAESNKKITAGLHQAGLIEKDKLANFPLAEKTLTRIYTDYPDYEKMNEVLYHLFLLESQMGNKTLADLYRNALAEKYADSKLAKMITNPNYELDSKYGRQMEDSLYRATYEAYRGGDIATILKNAAVSKQRYPEGDNRAKFMFFDALAQLHEGNREEFSSELDSLVKQFPKDDITPLAQAIVKGLKEGRKPGTGLYDLSSLWDRRTGGANAALDSLALAKALSIDRDVPFNVIIAYPVDSVDADMLLYDVAHYNFTNFSVRNFEIEEGGGNGLGELIVKGFVNFDEAHTYAQRLYNTPSVSRHLDHARLIVISNANLEKLGTDYSIADYQQFYDREFAPLKIKKDLQLDRQLDLYQSEDELPANYEDNSETQENEDATEDNSQEDDSETYPDAPDENSQDDDWYDIQ